MESSLYHVKLKYIEMELVEEYPEGTFSLKELKANGLGQVQVQARTSDELQNYIKAISSQLNFEN